jgi:hypothetical protein
MCLLLQESPCDSKSVLSEMTSENLTMCTKNQELKPCWNKQHFLHSLFSSVTLVTVRTSLHPSHIYFWHTHCRTPWISDQFIPTPLLWIIQFIKTREKNQCPKQNSKHTISTTSDQDICLRPHSHWDRHDHDLCCLLKWLTACIHFGCYFCTKFQHKMSLITGWNKSYYGVLHVWLLNRLHTAFSL